MFKLIINLAIAIAFSLTMQAQKNITGIWQQDEGSNYYTVILNNNEKGYVFTNFSFSQQNVVIQDFLNCDPLNVGRLQGNTYNTIYNIEKEIDNG